MLVLSDLHVEHATFDPAGFDADVVVLAGDIHAGGEAVRWARRTFPKHPVVQIAGNHEFYDGEYADVLARMRAQAREEGVHFLENDAVTIAGVRFLGCTLWTDFRIYEAPGRTLQIDRDQAMIKNLRLMADYHAIDVIDPRGANGRRRFSPLDAAHLHDASRAWLDRMLGTHDAVTAAVATTATAAPAMPTVVVSHHLPSWRSVAPAFARSVSNAAFVSDLDDLVGRSTVWIHGHTHSSHRYAVGGATLVCNPRGYPRHLKPGTAPSAAGPATDVTEFENPTFDAGLIVDVPMQACTASV
jgi:predicted phosphodiesterase